MTVSFETNGRFTDFVAFDNVGSGLCWIHDAFKRTIPTVLQQNFKNNYQRSTGADGRAKTARECHMNVITFSNLSAQCTNCRCTSAYCGSCSTWYLPADARGEIRRSRAMDTMDLPSNRNAPTLPNGTRVMCIFSPSVPYESDG